MLERSGLSMANLNDSYTSSLGLLGLLGSFYSITSYYSLFFPVISRIISSSVLSVSSCSLFAFTLFFSSSTNLDSYICRNEISKSYLLDFILLHSIQIVTLESRFWWESNFGPHPRDSITESMPIPDLGGVIGRWPCKVITWPRLEGGRWLRAHKTNSRAFILQVSLT